jgi:nucleotide-binding universal stress UspA family protein
LFPVDFSHQCSQFGAYVAAVAKRFQAEVTLLHVIDSTPLAYYGMDPAMSMAAAYAEAMAERRMKEIHAFLRYEFVNLSVKRISEPGDAAAVITQYALANGIDLIMTPTHGYGPFRRFLLGSVTAKILHDAECAVWTAAHVEDAAQPLTPAFGAVVCAVDLSQDSVPLLRSAARAAAELGVSLRLVHAVPAFEAATQWSMRTLGNPDLLYDSIRAEMEKLQKAAGTNAELRLEAGDVAKVVRNEALRQNAGLVVIGRGRMQETLGSLRTNTYAVVRESPCPVLSVYLSACREKIIDVDPALRPMSLAFM